LLTDLKTTFYEIGTLLHCFSDYSLDYHIVKAQNVLLWPIRRREGELAKARSPSVALSIALCWRPC